MVAVAQQEQSYDLFQGEANYQKDHVLTAFGQQT
jgi:hypothetical protein